jgi:hypothetical protein
MSTTEEENYLMDARSSSLEPEAREKRHQLKMRRRNQNREG